MQPTKRTTVNECMYLVPFHRCRVARLGVHTCTLHLAHSDMSDCSLITPRDFLLFFFFFSPQSFAVDILKYVIITQTYSAFMSTQRRLYIYRLLK